MGGAPVPRAFHPSSIPGAALHHGNSPQASPLPPQIPLQDPTEPWVQHATAALQVPGKPEHPQSACCRQGAGRGRQGSLARHCLISETVQSLPWHEATRNGFSSDNPSSPLNSIKTIRED